jgi:endonuclease YncB( thermonuclease family)
MPRLGLLAVCAVFLVSQGVLPARQWERLEGCEYFEGVYSDGDSIEVHRDGEHYVFRLYFVDCVEKNPASRARRRTQGEYFGLKASEGTPLRAAYLAKNYTKERLREPFTVYTRWQPVDPDGDNPAVRAFVVTTGGDDLATLLVSEGLAIIRHGETAVSNHPNGRRSAEISADLRKAEAEARARKLGAWGLVAASVSDQRQEILMATDREALVSRAGTRVRVWGRVSRVGALPNGRLTFINFSTKAGEGFVGVIRANALPGFLKQFPKGLRSALVDKNVLLEGVITLHKGAPQIELESPAQLRIERPGEKPPSTALASSVTPRIADFRTMTWSAPARNSRSLTSD